MWKRDTRQRRRNQNWPRRHEATESPCLLSHRACRARQETMLLSDVVVIQRPGRGSGDPGRRHTHLRESRPTARGMQGILHTASYCMSAGEPGCATAHPSKDMLT